MGCNNSTVIENENARELLSTIDFGNYKLKNRIMMAAMTRQKADPTTGVPSDLHVDYFTQRGEDAGVVLTECVAVRQDGEGFPGNGQAFKKEHFAGWKKVADSVHKVGGKIFAQIYHAGRATDSTKIGGLQVVGPSAIKNRYEGKFDEPKALDKKGIKELISAFVDSARNFKEIGFDGVELHAANGYLIDQFLKDSTNNRNDEYGGSIENRARFLLELVDEIAKVIGASRIGVKLTPGGRYNDMFDSNPQSILDYVLPQLNKRKICFVEIVRPPDGTASLYDIKGEDQLPNLFNGLKKKLPDVVLVGNSNITPEEADDLIKKKEIDMVSFAKNYIANVDLANRIRHKWPLSSPDWSKLYSSGAEGYSDYKKYTPPVEEKTSEVKK